MIGGILLAAGCGTRSGASNKLLVRDRDGVAMACRSAMALRSSRVDRIRVVLGYQADPVRMAIEEHCPGLPGVLAPDHADGLAASLVRGIEAAVRDGWDAAVVCLADMPLVGHDLIDRLIGAYRAAMPAPDAVVPRAAGRRGNPVLWDARMFPLLLQLRGDRGGRDLLAGPGVSVLAVDVADDAVLVDHDTPDALARFAAAGQSPLPPQARHHLATPTQTNGGPGPQAPAGPGQSPGD